MNREIPFVTEQMEARIRLMYMMDIITRYGAGAAIYDLMVDNKKDGTRLNPEYVKEKDVFGYNFKIDTITGVNGRGLLGAFRVRETEKSFIIYCNIARISKKKLMLYKLKGKQ